MAYNAYPSVAATSLSASGSIAEEMYPLWVYSSGTTSTTSPSGSIIQKGTTSGAVSLSSATTLHTLNSNWPAGQKFALEVSIYTNNASGVTTAMLIDGTGGGLIASVTTSSTTATLVRSSTFTLSQSEKLALQIKTNNSSYTAYLTKAHLVALEM